MNRTLKYALSAALTALMVVPAIAQDNFPDVPESHWAYKELARMKAEGLLVGYPDGLFRGGRPASRYELAVAVHAVWANLKGITDGLNGQINDIMTRLGTMPTKQDLENLREALDALKAEVARIRSEDIAGLRRLTDEFRAELTKMGADVDQMKKDLAGLGDRVNELWQHRLPFDVTGDVNLWMGAGHGRDADFGITVDGRPTGVARNFGGGTAGITQDLTMLHEGDLTLVSNNKTGPHWKASMVFGNMIGDGAAGAGAPFFNQSRVIPGVPFAEGTSAWYFQEFNVNFDTSIAGLGFNAELGRVGYKVSPYIFQRPDTTPYFSNERWDNGDWNFDGAVLGFHFGSAKFTAFGGRTSSQNATNFTSLQPMFAGAAGNPFTPGSGDRPRGFERNNSMSTGAGLAIDQQLGLNLNVPISSTGSLSLAYLWLDSNAGTTVVNGGGAFGANRVTVWGGNLNFNFANIGISGGYSRSDVMANNTSIISRDNAAWYAQADYNAKQWGLNIGYRRIEPQFAAPGDWGRIGIWWNPTDIKGVYGSAHFDLSGNLRLLADGGMYTGTGTTLVNGGGGTDVGLSTDDKLNHARIGLGFKMGTNGSLLLGYEGVWWDIADRPGVLFTGGTPRETWWNIGWGFNLGNRTNFNVTYQISDYNSNGVAGFNPFGAGVGAGAGRARGGLITTTLNVKF